jgi:hypothetical protein
MVSLVGASVWIALRHRLLLEYFYFSELLALTHLLTLGFISSLMMGVLIRLAPMALGVSARSGRLSILQYLLFLIGASGMVSHFWLGSWTGMAWATPLVMAAALIQVVNFSGIFTRARRADWVARFVAASLLHFVLAAALGVLLGFNKVLAKDWSLLPAPILSNLSAHAHLAAVGWVTSMIFGFQLKLVPTTRGAERSLPWRFGLLQGGLLGLVAVLLADLPGTGFFAASIAAAVVWQAWGPTRALLTARAREWEAVPLLFLVGVSLIGLLLAWGVPEEGSAFRAKLQLAYGYSGLFGWIVFTITAVAFKLFPIWVWQERFQADFGRKPVPGMKDLYLHGLRVGSHLLLAAGVIGTAAGIFWGARPMLAVGSALVVLGVVSFIFNFVRMARWGLLPGEYRPSEAEWAKFREMFPPRG